jgi:alcohol dehydrogenase (NADP+)
MSLLPGREEQFYQGPVGATMTYNGYFTRDGSGFNTFGGFSSRIVADEKFVLSIPKQLKLSCAAPMLCARVTTYSPLKHWNVKAHDKIGIVGIGGLWHMAVMADHIGWASDENFGRSVVAVGCCDRIDRQS